MLSRIRLRHSPVKSITGWVKRIWLVVGLAFLWLPFVSNLYNIVIEESSISCDVMEFAGHVTWTCTQLNYSCRPLYVISIVYFLYGRGVCSRISNRKILICIHGSSINGIWAKVLPVDTEQIYSLYEQKTTLPSSYLAASLIEPHI